MHTLVHADMFFFVSTIGFILIFGALFVGLLYIIGILKSVRTISRKLEGDVDVISAEAKDFFQDIQSSVVYRMIFGKKRRLK